MVHEKYLFSDSSAILQQKSAVDFFSLLLWIKSQKQNLLAKFNA